MSWRDTLFIWRGRLEEINKDQDRRYVQWKGTWVGVEDCPDARMAPTPNEQAFETSEMTFCVKGWIEGTNSSLWKAELTDGDGWDLHNGESIDKHTDRQHTLLMSDYPMSKAGSRVLIIAKGDNDFAPFLSAGYCYGNEMTIARRYLEHRDKRNRWTVDNLFQKTREMDDHFNVNLQEPLWKRAPWRVVHLHSLEVRFNKETSSRGNKRKRAGTEEAAAAATRFTALPRLKISQTDFASDLSFEKDARGKARLVSNVQWQEQCSGCGKEITADAMFPFCASVEEHTPDGTVVGFMGKIFYCRKECSTKHGSNAWGRLGESWKGDSTLEGHRLVARQESNAFWNVLWGNDQARANLEKGGWQKDDKGNICIW